MTAAQLLEVWLERDHRYARRRFNGKFMPLSPAEESAVRAWRHEEILVLPGDHGDLLENLTLWQPPAEMR